MLCTNNITKHNSIIKITKILICLHAVNNIKNSLIIHEENTKKNHKRVVCLYICDRDFP